MNALSSNTIFSSKIVRSFLAARNKIYVATCSPVRGHAHEAALKFGRSAYILGSASGMVPGFARKYNIPYESKARAFHAFIKSFSTEIEALRACASIFPNSSVMVDTYDTNQGIENIITVCKEQKTKKLPVFSAVFIDSGKNLKAFINQAKMIRRKLDQNGLKEVQITVAGNFEEYKIDQLVKKKAPIDKVIMGTELVAPSDDPKVEVVLKMAQFVKNGEVHSTAKLATGKVSYPGLKQVFRKYKNGIMDGDTIGLEVERPGTPLLIDYIKSGKLVREMPTLDQIKEFTFAQLETLPEMLKRVDKEFNYDVKFSARLDQLLAEARRVHQSKHL
jgi:nicotinate phosphoribosyltransferase